MIQETTPGTLDLCLVLRERLQELQDQLASLESIDVGDLTAAEKGQRNQQIQFVRRQIADTEAELRACDRRPPRVPGLHVFGSEVNQGLLGYAPVAGKDTLVRIFVGAVSSERPATLDFADLEIRGPEALAFTVPATMSGSFSNGARSYSEADNVNFYLARHQLPLVGRYSFHARLYRAGVEIGELDLGSKSFQATKDLRILIVVDQWPMAASSWAAVQQALLYVNRNFPVRSGVGPLDGDRTVGVRYAIDPQPFNYDQDFPIWNTGIDRLDRFNTSQTGPDRADRILIVREQQPGEGPLGGTAQLCGRVAGAVLNRGANYFATIISQEVGHTFCLFHSPNASIVDPSAFDLLNRRSIVTPAPLMFNPVGPDPNTLLEVGDWDSTRRRMLQLPSTGP
jgi:hypothetical protein